jgi:hypothetical protein
LWPQIAVVVRSLWPCHRFAVYIGAEMLHEEGQRRFVSAGGIVVKRFLDMSSERRARSLAVASIS